MTSYRPMPLRLETERLLLRPWRIEDVEALDALHRERSGDSPTLEQTRRFLADEPANAAERGFALLPIERRTEGGFIGYCGLVVGRASADEPELAYELFERVHGNGYATEAARAVLAAAATTGRKRLWSTVRTWNAPSFRVLDKLGFERHHVTADDRGEIVWLTRALP